MIKRITIHEIDGMKILAVDNEGFDWGIDEEGLKKAALKIKKDPHMREMYVGNIQKHFIKSMSEFLGKEVTLKEVNDAIESGSIEV